MDILCQMLNDQKNWIWAKADPADWDIVREELALTGKSLGVRQQHHVQVQRNAATPRPFIGGPITLMQRREAKDGNPTGWYVVCLIERPRSFRVSCNLVNKRPLLRYRVGGYRHCSSHSPSLSGQDRNTTRVSNL